MLMLRNRVRGAEMPQVWMPRINGKRKEEKAMSENRMPTIGDYARAISAKMEELTGKTPGVHGNSLLFDCYVSVNLQEQYSSYWSSRKRGRHYAEVRGWKSDPRKFLEGKKYAHLAPEDSGFDRWIDVDAIAQHTIDIIKASREGLEDELQRKIRFSVREEALAKAGLHPPRHIRIKDESVEGRIEVNITANNPGANITVKIFVPDESLYQVPAIVRLLDSLIEESDETYQKVCHAGPVDWFPRRHTDRAGDTWLLQSNEDGPDTWRLEEEEEHEHQDTA